MDKLTWELLAEIQGRLEAEMLQSYLQAHGVHVELFQEAVGHHVYPVTVNGLGLVQIFTPKSQADEARRWLEEYASRSND
ncbi:MAG TPA: hypothetical protein VGJ22_09290 [Anaerolineales bacterium]